MRSTGSPNVKGVPLRALLSCAVVGAWRGRSCCQKDGAAKLSRRGPSSLHSKRYKVVDFPQFSEGPDALNALNPEAQVACKGKGGGGGRHHFSLDLGLERPPRALLVDRPVVYQDSSSDLWGLACNEP